MTANMQSGFPHLNCVCAGTNSFEKEPFDAVALDMSDKPVSAITRSTSGLALDEDQHLGRLQPSATFHNFHFDDNTSIGNDERRRATLHRNKTTGDDDMCSGQRVKLGNHYKKRTTLLSVAHRNDKNDNDSNLTFKKFRRSLSILKRSLHVVDEETKFGLDFDSDYGSINSSDESSESQYEDSDDEEGVEGEEHSTALEEDDELPSSYAIGTSLRSMQSLSRKTKMPIDVDNKRRKKLKWLKSFYHLDPRWQICNFFDDLAYEGVGGIDETGRIKNSGLHLPSIMRAFSRVGVFSVWRPTSNEAIRRMISGEGTGKGMDIKGKSAKRGKWSGYVPFLQIHNNEDKLKIGSLHADARVRVFYPNKLSRDRAFMSMSMKRDSMIETTMRSIRLINEVENKEAFILQMEMQKSLQNQSHSHCSEISMKTAIEATRKRLNTVFDYSKIEAALEAKHRNIMIDDDVYKIDDYASDAQGQGCYGLDIPEKLFWETYVAKADISREDGSEYDTGRASMPEFQVMNLESLRKAPKTGPRPVLWHAGCGKVGEEPPQNVNPLCPLGLLMAYEEGDIDGGKVTPVVSDFDCFLVGTRGVEYRDPMGEQELSMLKWCVDEIEGVLDINAKDVGGEGGDWTRQWLDVKKKYAFDPRFQIPMPKMGYADPRSSAMMNGAVYSLKENGAVRHGPECFNYSFPQQLDDKFLVISDTLPGLVPWKYVDIDELKEILSDKIDEGFAFPLNPKWILCDEGWKGLYDKLLASEAPNVQDAMNVWYPDDVRERIATISSKYPVGFGSSDVNDDNTSEGLGLKRMNRRFAIVDYEKFNAEIAELELQRYKSARSGKMKFRGAIFNAKMRRKKKMNSFFSCVLTMIDIGKEADSQKKCVEVEIEEDSGSQKSVTKKRSNKLRRGSTFDSEHTASSDHSEKPAMIQSDVKNAIDRRLSRSRSLANYLRKRLSISSKKKKKKNDEVKISRRFSS